MIYRPKGKSSIDIYQVPCQRAKHPNFSVWRETMCGMMWVCAQWVQPEVRFFRFYDVQTFDGNRFLWLIILVKNGRITVIQLVLAYSPLMSSYFVLSILWISVRIHQGPLTHKWTKNAYLILSLSRVCNQNQIMYAGSYLCQLLNLLGINICVVINSNSTDSLSMVFWSRHHQPT